MDTVVLDGVSYEKASVVAKRFKYTSDYVGQLCRGKKIDARLVGRTWFVNPDSLKNHKKAVRTSKSSEAQSTEIPPHKNTSQSADRASKTKSHLIPINAPLKNKTAKSTKKQNTEPARSRTISVRYQDDTEELIPALKHMQSKVPVVIDSKRPKVARVEAPQLKKLKIGSGSKKPTSFEPEELPEVALSGKIAVLEYKNKLPEEKPSKKLDHNAREVVVRPGASTSSKKPKLESAVQESTVTKQKIVPSSFAPAGVSKSEQQRKRPNALVLLSPLLATILALVVTVVVFSASSRTVVDSETSASGIVLQLQDLLTLFSD